MDLLPGLLLVFVLAFQACSSGFQLQGADGPLVAQLGGSVLLPCSAETPLPLEELEVEWRRTDSDALVHLFQEGEVRPESQNEGYRDRALFTGEIAKGNYSLLLSNMTTEDAGVYSCNVYTGEESGDVRVEVKGFEYLVVNGSDQAVSLHVGEKVTLNCSVDSHAKPERMVVTWKRTDENILVLLFQDGEVLSDSSHERYRGRAEFFTSEIPKGNFSLRLKDVRTEDEGEYICEAFSGPLSAQTTVKLEKTDVPLRVLVLMLCVLVLVLTVGLSIPGVIHLKKKDTGLKAMTTHLLLVFCPNIILSIALMMYGLTEVTSINILRILLLFKTAPYLERFCERIKAFMKNWNVTLVHLALSGVLYSVKMSYVTTEQHIIQIVVFFGLYPLHLFLRFTGTWSFTYLDAINWAHLWMGASNTKGFNLNMYIITLLGMIGSNILFHLQEYSSQHNHSGYALWTTFLPIVYPLYTLAHLYRINEIFGNTPGHMGYIYGNALLLILTAISGFQHPTKLPDKPHIILYMFGAAGLPSVNSLALATCVWKTKEGQDNVYGVLVDVLMISLISEIIFLTGWLALLIYEYWIRRREIIKHQLKNLCQRSQAVDVAEGHEMETLSGFTNPPEVNVAESTKGI